MRQIFNDLNIGFNDFIITQGKELNNYEAIAISPKIGASWEGFALEQIIRHYNAEPEEYYFWASHSTAEIDLIIVKNGKKIGFEFKYTDTPKITSSIKIS